MIPRMPGAPNAHAQPEPSPEVRRLALRLRIMALEQCASEFAVSRWRSFWEGAR